MKRIYSLLIVLICMLIPNIILASNIQIRVTGNDEIKKLEYLVDGEKISFNEAKTKYRVEDYSSVLTTEGEYYFYQSKQITKEEYVYGLDSSNADKRVELYGEYGIRVHNTQDIVNNIKKLYDKRVNGEYHLIYSKSEYNTIDFNEIDKFVTDNYLMDKKKNIFKYSEYGIFNYPRFLYDHSESELMVRVSSIITRNEEEKLASFMNVFKKEFESKTDYEKVLIAYTYLNKTIYENGDCASNVSAYNAIVDRECGCIGRANAFSYIMDNVGIESYIANNAVSKGDSIISTHTFNVVKLNGQYYIVDLMLDGYSGFLTVNNEKIIFSNGVMISDHAYQSDYLSVSIDYNKYDKLIDKISREIKHEESLNKKDEELKSVDFVSYTVLIIILLVLTIIIIIFTRKK